MQPVVEWRDNVVPSESNPRWRHEKEASPNRLILEQSRLQ